MRQEEAKEEKLLGSKKPQDQCSSVFLIKLQRTGTAFQLSQSAATGGMRAVIILLGLDTSGSFVTHINLGTHIDTQVPKYGLLHGM